MHLHLALLAFVLFTHRLQNSKLSFFRIKLHHNASKKFHGGLEHQTVNLNFHCKGNVLLNSQSGKFVRKSPTPDLKLYKN